MSAIRPNFALLSAAALLFGCQRGAVQLAPAPSEATARSNAPASAAPAQDPGEDVLSLVASMNERVPLPSAKFRPGEVEALEFDTEQITKTGAGFT